MRLEEDTGSADTTKQILVRFLGGHGTWFTAKLLRLINVADLDNLRKIRSVYPEVVEVYEAWFRAKYPWRFE